MTTPNNSGSPQEQFYNDQDFVSPDIESLYNNIIKDIDAHRSRFNAINTSLSESISQEEIDKVFSSTDMNTTNYQESRTSAFFRMIGFPVVSPDSQLYSPGFDPSLNSDNARFTDNLKIANSAIKALKIILNAREEYSKNSSNLFKLQDNAAIAMAIASIYARPFDQQLKQGLDPLVADKQTFNVPDRDNVYDLFDDENILANQIGIDHLKLNTSIHILKPFIVDPRIELTITPAMNRICAPFLEDKSKTQLYANSYLKRPFIERIISIRFNTQNVTMGQGSSPFIDNLISFIKENSQFTDASLIDSTADTLSSLYKSEQIAFDHYIKIIKSLIKELVNAKFAIEKISTQMNWKPIPNVGGPEFGSTTKDVDPKDVQNKQIENNITTAQTNKFMQEINFDVGNSTPDVGNFSFSNIDDIIFGSIKNVSNFYEKQLKDLERRRDNLGNKANSHLRNIEIISGEFSGLGLLDIMAIQTALWIMDKSALIGLIDVAARQRMQKNNNLLYTGSIDPPLTALAEFEKKLSEVYILIQAFYNDEVGNPLKNK